jgi:hypothetical protein
MKQNSWNVVASYNALQSIERRLLIGNEPAHGNGKLSLDYSDLAGFTQTLKTMRD